MIRRGGRGVRAPGDLDRDGRLDTARRTKGLRKGEGAIGRLAETRDRSRSPTSPWRAPTRAGCARPSSAPASLGARGAHHPGGPHPGRARAQPADGRGFGPAVVEVLKTFATQSALAIHNARLFHELAEKGRQLEVANRHKSRVPGQHEPRAADAAERHHRLLGDAPGGGAKTWSRRRWCRTCGRSTAPASTCSS